jgi:flagellar biosynthesis protein
VDLDSHIPPQLYLAIAELLAWLYRLESQGHALEQQQLSRKIA